MPPAQADNPLYRSFLEGAPGRPIIDKWHHYFDAYHAHFAPFRGKAPTVLEIGVQNGGSMRLWQEYFGPGARLFGLDIDPACAARAPQGAKVFIGDQADPNVLLRILDEIGPPDIVIDDGGHTARQMIVSFYVLFRRMKAPGVYLAEDTHTQFWGGEWSDDPEGRDFMSYAFGVVAAMHEWTRNLRNFPRMRLPPDRRPGPEPEVSDICRLTGSVTFYDSIVVFTREDRQEPWVEYRVQDPSLGEEPDPDVACVEAARRGRKP
jgi:hypothetical protein